MTYVILIPFVLANLGYWTPQQRDADMIRGVAFVTEITETTVSGFLPTGCHQVRIDDSYDPVLVYSVLDPESHCLQTITPFFVKWRR